MKTMTRYGSLLAVVLCLTAPARADLLTTADQTQLESWLGQGNLAFTSIYTMAPGDTTADFHAAVDGRGPTFVLMDIYGNGGIGSFNLIDQVVGGYDPQSWSSFGGYNEPADRNAFIFNLSYDIIESQNSLPYQGQFQTYDGSTVGPAFGAGFDLSAGIGFAGSGSGLGLGFADQYSYSGGVIVNGVAAYNSPNTSNYAFGAVDAFYVSALEVYTFAPARDNVPDASGTIGLLSAALAGLAALRRRFAKQGW